MRRGLMKWDADELPLAALNARVGRLQSAMAKAGQDAMILYTNFIRSGAVSYLTAFSPYWADGLLLVPREGEPVFATTLSKRVGSWIQTVKPVGDLVNSPRPAEVLGKRLAAMKAKRVAILELDDFPSGLYDDLAAVLPGAEFVDGTQIFAEARARVDAAERGLLVGTDRIARDALGQLAHSAVTVGEAAGIVEKHARLAGAEEIYVAITPDLDRGRTFLRLSGSAPLGTRFAVRASVAYKGTWVRRIRTFARDESDARAIKRADAWLDALLAGIGGTQPLQRQIEAAVGEIPGARLENWLAEAPVGTRPLAMIASSGGSSALTASVLVLTVSLTIDRNPWCGAGLVLPPEAQP